MGKRIALHTLNCYLTLSISVCHRFSISLTITFHIRFADGLYEKNIDTLSITGNELNYKFPIDDIIYTIDEASLQPTTQPNLISFTTRNG